MVGGLVNFLRNYDYYEQSIDVSVFVGGTLYSLIMALREMGSKDGHSTCLIVKARLTSSLTGTSGIYYEVLCERRCQ